MLQIVRCEFGTVHPGPYALEVEADGRCSHCAKLPWMVRRAGAPPTGSVNVVDTIQREPWDGFLMALVEAGRRLAGRTLSLFTP